MSGLPPPFTWARYAYYLQLATTCGYRFATFDEVRGGRAVPDGRVIYLRHDIDYALRWVRPMAEVEHANGVQATYCFMLDSPYYSSATDAFDRTVEALLGLGHR